MKNALGFLIPPVYADESRNRQAGLLFAILVSLLALALVYLVFSLIFSPETAAEDLIIAGTGILLNLGLLFLLKKGHLRLASVLQVASFWLTLTAIAFSLDGISGPAYGTGYLLTILIAGILLGGRGALYTTIASLLAGVVLVYTERNGLLQFRAALQVESVWVVSAFMFPMSAILQYMAARTLRHALRNASDSEHKYRTLSDAALEGVMLHRGGVILDLNHRFAEIFGYQNPGELIGRNGYQILLTPASAEELVRQSRQNPEGIYEVQGVRKDGTVFTGETQSRRIVLEGDSATVVSMRDITQARLAEAELRRLNRALRTISKCNEALVRSGNREELLQEICRTIVDVGQYQVACIHLVEPCGADEYRQTYAYVYPLIAPNQRQARAVLDCRGELLPELQTLIHARKPVFVHSHEVASQPGSLAGLRLPDEYLSLAIFPLHFQGVVLGALMIFSERANAFDQNEVQLMSEMVADLSYGLHTQVVLHERNEFLQQLEIANHELEYSYEATLEGWSNALELRERETAGHSKRVVALTLEIAREMGMTELDFHHIRMGAMLHDIGKMGIPDAILNKPGPLTEDEWTTMRQHPMFAYNLLKNIPYLYQALDIPRLHHERWDGHGYPGKLSGENIPLAARIFAVVDVWDALTSNRPYRPAWSAEDARQYILDQSGRHFDPRVVEVFERMLSRREQP